MKVWLMLGYLTCAMTACAQGDEPHEPSDLAQLAEQGDAESQYKLGESYFTGNGVQQDDAEAVKWFQAAANQGLSDAQFRLGHMYDHGFGVAKDPREAFRWNRLAAEQSHLEATGRIALYYSVGFGVEKNEAQAEKWGWIHLEMMAAEGDAESQFRLAEKQEVKGNVSEALDWYRFSAGQGYHRAQTYLGYLYSEGVYVTQDYVEAHMWWNLASANPENEIAGLYRKRRDELALRMTHAQVAEAQRLARAWKRKDWEELRKQLSK